MMQMHIPKIDILVCVRVCVLVSYNALGLRIVSRYHGCFCQICLSVCVSSWYVCICVSKTKKD